LNIPLKILAACIISIILGCIFPVKVILFLVGSGIFVTFFIVLFYNNLFAGLIFTLAFTLLFDVSSRIDLARLPDITPGRVASFLLASLLVIKLALRQQKVILDQE